MKTPPSLSPVGLTTHELKTINAGLSAPTHRRICGCFDYGVALALMLMTMFLSLDMGETLGAAFGGCLVTLSVWLLYQWAIKPERESQRQNAWRANEEMHRNHWNRFRRWDLRSKKRYEAPTTCRNNTEGNLKRMNPLMIFDDEI